MNTSDFPQTVTAQREKWRREARLGYCATGIDGAFDRDYRILALLDALEVAERERDSADA